MRRIVLLFTVAATMAAAALAGGAALASEPPVILRIPINETIANPCNGESVLFTGTFQIVFHETTDASGGSHFIAEGNAQGIQGVSASGTKYRATGGFWDEFNSNNGATVFNSVGVFNIISQGTAPNFISEVTFKLTTNANGEPTAEVVHTNIKCAG